MQRSQKKKKKTITKIQIFLLKQSACFVIPVMIYKLKTIMKNCSNERYTLHFACPVEHLHSIVKFDVIFEEKERKE